MQIICHYIRTFCCSVQLVSRCCLVVQASGLRLLFRGGNPLFPFGKVFIRSTAISSDIIPQSNQGRESDLCELPLINGIQSIANIRPSFDSF
jgi:hypothetical protein